MPNSDSPWPLPSPEARSFSTTHWSVVLLAADEESPEAVKALEHLCRNYWYPLYAHVRRSGHTAEDAQDLTQEFFARFLERKYLRLADPERGRFRTFLLTSLNHFLINEWRRGQRIKRGAGHAFLALDEQTAESRYLAEPVDGLTPDKLYDKRWAVALVEKVLSRLGEEYAAVGKVTLFDGLKPQLVGESDGQGYCLLAQRLGTSEGALRVAALRLRERYRELLRAEVTHTVATPPEVDEELRHLIDVLRR